MAVGSLNDPYRTKATHTKGGAEMINVANDFIFAVYVGFGGMAVFLVLCLITAIFEGISDAIERKRRKKYRNNYVKFN